MKRIFIYILFHQFSLLENLSAENLCSYFTHILLTCFFIPSQVLTHFTHKIPQTLPFSFSHSQVTLVQKGWNTAFVSTRIFRTSLLCYFPYNTKPLILFHSLSLSLFLFLLFLNQNLYCLADERSQRTSKIQQQKNLLNLLTINKISAKYFAESKTPFFFLHSFSLSMDKIFYFFINS